MPGLQMEPVISKGLRQESANTKATYSGTSHWDRMLRLLHRGCGNTEPCHQLPEKVTDEERDYNLHWLQP